MPIDIVFPKNNEEKFLKMAEKLGYDTLYFCYPYEKPSIIEKRTSQYKAKPAILFDKKTSSKAGNLLGIAKTSDARHFLEKTRVNMVYGLETSSRPDFMHHRNSGLNQVLCELAEERGKTVAFSFSEILNAQNRGKLLGRMRQNISLCRKYKVSTFIGSFASDPFDMRSPHDLKAFFTTLGMSTKQLKHSFDV